MKTSIIKQHIVDIPWFMLSLTFALFGLMQLQKAYYTGDDLMASILPYFIIFVGLWLIGWVAVFLMVQSKRNIKNTLIQYKINEVK